MITVVNMIPACMSGEFGQDSEPFLTVDPQNTNHMVATAFTSDPCRPRAMASPIYVSTDGGTTWTMHSIIPIAQVLDQTVGLSRDGSHLFAAAIEASTDDFVTVICRTAHPFHGELMEIVDSVSGMDQPVVAMGTLTVGGGSRDRLFVGGNRGAPGDRISTVVISLDASAPAPDFVPVTLENRAYAVQDAPSTRVAIHPSGVAYAAFYHVTQAPDGPDAPYRADVVVLRDDDPGSGGAAFDDLLDPGDHQGGMRVVRDVQTRLGALGNERVGSELSVAVDPSSSAIVYLAYADAPGGIHTIHVLKSQDSGRTWSELVAVDNATNPALAVNAWGDLGLLHQALDGTRWRTVFTRFRATVREVFILSEFDDGTPPFAGDPYLGDFVQLLSIDTDFYGVFSAGNVPDMGNFPQRVLYQRAADFGAHVLDDGQGTAVAPSIDPFFFHWEPDLPTVSGISYAFDDCGLPPAAGDVAGFWVYTRETSERENVGYRWTIRGATPYGSTSERTVSVQLPPPASDGSVAPVDLRVEVTVSFPGTAHEDVVIERRMRFTPLTADQQRVGRWFCRYREMVFPLPPWIFSRVGPDPYPRVTWGDAIDSARRVLSRTAARLARTFLDQLSGSDGNPRKT